MAQKIILLHNDDVKIPTSLQGGELAVQNAATEAAIYLKKGTKIAKIVDSEAVMDIAANAANVVADMLGDGFSSANTVESAIETVEGDLSDHVNDEVSHVTAEDKAAWNAAEQNAKDYADSADAELKATIDAYTVNGKTVSTNPVLDGADVALSEDYAKATGTTSALAAGDSLDVALGKLEKQIDNAVAGGLQEVEDGDGIYVTTVAENKQTISIKLDDSTTDAGFLSVGPDGLALDGITERISIDIEDEIGRLNATAGTQTVATGKHVAVEVVEANGKLTAVNVAEDDIASADDLSTLSASVAILSGAVETLSGNIETVIDDAVEAAEEYIDNAIAAESARSETTYATKAYENKVDTLVGTDTGKSVRVIATEEAASAVAEIVDGAPETFDTLKEIAEWIAEDPTHSADIVTDINNLKTRMTTAEGDIDALETLVGDTAVATQISNAIAAETARTESAYDAKGDAAQALADAKEYADGLNSAMDARIDTLEAIDADSRLDAIEADYLKDADKTELSDAIAALDATNLYMDNAAEEKVTIASAIADAIENAGVTAFGGQKGAITLDADNTVDGKVNFAMNGNELTGEVVGLEKYALSANLDTLSASVVSNYATSAQTVDAVDAVNTKVEELSGSVVSDYATSAQTVDAIEAVNDKFADYATSADTVAAIGVVDEKLEALAADVISTVEFTNAGTNGATINASVSDNKATFNFSDFVIDGGTY